MSKERKEQADIRRRQERQDRKEGKKVKRETSTPWSHDG